MKIFISHITEEASLASVLKEWIESSFAGQCNVFVSSDKDNIPAGGRWLEEINRALNEAVALIVICSPASLMRPWINFETGCGWIKDVPIIPICHSGQTKATLPPPMSMFQALELEDEKCINDLLSSLAKHLQFSKIPRIDQKNMKQELLAAIKARAVPVPKERAITEEKIPQEAVEILKVLGQVSGSQPTASELAGNFKMTEQRVLYFLDHLKKGKLIHFSLYINSPATYSLTSDGRKYLFDRGLL